ncbi:MAG: membrane protein insertase YidC, partial [Tannerella sp.]|nr:membrane protein insertase YidC [Tannerella sp.]
MDKNTVIGFVLIGLVLIGFSWFNRPSKEQTEARQRYQDSIASVMKEIREQAVPEQGKNDASFSEATEGLSDSLRQMQVRNNFGAFAAAVAGTDEVITLENNNIEVKISSKGGHICYARVKDYV